MFRALIFTTLLSCVLHSCVGKPLKDDEYVEFINGTLNVILSAPHGGYNIPEGLPRRTHGCWTDEGCVWRHGCGEVDPVRCRGVNGRDGNTQEMTRELRQALCDLFDGRCPPVVINKVSRSRFDANRDKDPATFGVPEMVEAWETWHKYIDDAKAAVGGPALYFDIHGHGHSVQQVELGYLISGADLDNNNLNSTTSSIRSLDTRYPNIEFNTLLRGEYSFGDFIVEEGFPVVPAPGTGGPEGLPYFYGLNAYNTQRHGSRAEGVVDAIQIESCRDHRSDTIRPAYVRAIARAIYNFRTLYYGDNQ